MTKKRQAEVLRSARIFNEHGIATIEWLRSFMYLPTAPGLGTPI